MDFLNCFLLFCFWIAVRSRVMIIIVFLIAFHHAPWTLLVQDTHQDFKELTAADEWPNICHYHVDDGKGTEMFYVCHDVTAGEVVFNGCSRPESAAWGQSIYSHEVVCVCETYCGKKHASHRSKTALFRSVFVCLRLFFSSSDTQATHKQQIIHDLMIDYHQVLKWKKKRHAETICLHIVHTVVISSKLD